MRDSLRGEIRSASMARVLCRANSLLDPAVDEDIIYKRLQFLSYELKEHCTNVSEPEQLLEALLEFFFEIKSYNCSAHHQTLDHLASTLISTRRAHMEVVTTVFCTLAYEVQLPLQILAVKPMRFVRLASSPVVFDLGQGGRRLSSQDLIEVLQNHEPLETHNQSAYLDTAEALVRYLTHLKECPPCAGNLSLQLALQTQLIELCPHRVGLYGERALTHYQLGKDQEASKDLKRYFSFQDKEQGPSELLDLMAKLQL